VRSLIFAFVVASAACADHEAAELSLVKARVCACKDVKCAETALAEVPHPDDKPSHRSQSIARDMLDCYAKLTEAQRPSTDPDAQPDPGSAAP
jgi:hypothetical protein